MKYGADTWFLLATFDKDEESTRIFREIREGKAHLTIPIIAFAEATKKLLQRGIALSNIDWFFAAVEASEKVELTPLDRQTAQEAAKISLTYNVPLIDALIAATCKLAGCHILLSGDQDYQLLARKKYLAVRSW